ncbi:MAG: tetratricopeptide repeat protein [Candidatus Taylorbacteria bacterium]
MKSQKIAFYTFLVTVILSPIIFWPSSYMAIDTMKTTLIGLGVIISVVILGYASFREKKLVLPPKQIFWTSLLIVVSLMVSAFVSSHAGKSMFGQGFEFNTVSFLATLFVAGLVTFTLVQSRLERAVILYVGIFASYFVVFLFQLLRVLFGATFASFSVFMSGTSSILGNWLDIGTYSMTVLLISIIAIMLLPLSKKMRVVYWIIAVLSFLGVFIVGNPSVWTMAFLVLLGFTVFTSMRRIRSKNYGFFGAMKHLAWLPLIVCIIAGVMVWKSDSISAPIIKKMNVSYSGVALPWQMTLDIASGAIKQNPLFGVGANHFVQAYLQNKPDAVNMSDAWNIEFAYGFGLIPTLIAEQGAVGLVLWILFFVFLGLAGSKVLRHMGEDPRGRFIIVSSYITSVFLWLVCIVSVPSHVVLLLTLIMTGVFFGASVHNKSIQPITIEPAAGRGRALLIVGLILAIIVAVIWGMIYMKKIVALSYFGKGVKQLTVDKNADLALASFATAYNTDRLDVYLQGKTEAQLTKANAIATEASKSTNASTTEELVKKFADVVNTALLDARAAITYDTNDYYNHVSEARVSELASNIKLENAYENATKAYTAAIQLNPKNPSIYLSLAKLEISQKKLDESVKTIGAALQLKPNYIDAVFLLSQVYAEKGDLPNAIIAAKFATQLNPQNQQVFFQLGLLQYNNANYAEATTSLATALTIQPDYSNAQYFLGLSLARLGKTKDAITQFEALSKANPENQEVLEILKNLNAGKSIFTDPKTVANPEKRPALPIKTPTKSTK